MSAPTRAAGCRSRVRAALLGGLLAASCATYVDTIERGQRYYEDNQYERALALWRDLDRRGAELAPADRARFAYFRGMTDYRLGFREEARHWLAVARAQQLTARGALDPAWLERLDGALADLERDEPRGAGANDAVQTIELPPDAVLPEAVPPEAAADPGGTGTTRPAEPAAPPEPSLPAAPPPAAPRSHTPQAAVPDPERR